MENLKIKKFKLGYTANRAMAVYGSLRVAKQWTKVLGLQSFHIKRLSVEELHEVTYFFNTFHVSSL